MSFFVMHGQKNGNTIFLRQAALARESLYCSFWNKSINFNRERRSAHAPRPPARYHALRTNGSRKFGSACSMCSLILKQYDSPRRLQHHSCLGCDCKNYLPVCFKAKMTAWILREALNLVLLSKPTFWIPIETN